MKRQVRALGLAVGVVAVLSGTVAAGHLTEAVKSYTGCLASKDGVIIRIKEGEAPSSPCSGGMVEVHFSGGDITRISVTGALTGGGDNGEVTIGLKPEFTLPSACDAGEIAEWSGSAWVCGVDDDTTYLEGTGLDLTGTTFSIEPTYRVKTTPDCPSGQFSTGFTDAGTITCAAPAAALPDAWFRHASGDAPQGHDNEITSLFLLAGNYLVNVVGDASDNFEGNDEVAVYCALRAGAAGTTLAGANAYAPSTESSLAYATLAMTTVLKLTATTELVVECTSTTGSDNVEISLTVMKVGTVS
jgi:hypothetical protein